MLKSLLSHATTTILEEAVYSELYASHLYKHVANQCQRVGLLGAAAFFKKESADELEHYQKWADYLNDRGGLVLLPELPAITDSVTDLGGALTLAYDTEVDLGEKYSGWYSAILSSDPTTAGYMLQFLDIQRSSVGEFGDLLTRFALARDNPAAILMMDEALGE